MRVCPWVVALVGLVVVSAAARAQPLDAVLVPAHPLVADGARVHTLALYLGDAGRDPTLPSVRVAAGALVGAPWRASDGGIRLRYRPPRVSAPGADALTATLGGREARLGIVLEPAGRLRLAVEGPAAPLLLQKGAQAELKLHVRDAAGRPASAPLRLGASIGRVGAAHEVAPGEYRAVYTPPDDRYPQVAIVAALDVAGGAFAAAPIKLAARVALAGEGEPGATVTVSVDGRTAAPVTVGPSGRFTVPLVVPPGGRAVGTSVDALGNRTRHEIDLGLPPFPRLVLGAVPATLRADGRAEAELVAFAVDARGNPERDSAPALRVDAGELSPPASRGDGVTTWTFTAPARRGSGVVTARAGHAETRLELRPGPPRSLEVTPLPEPLGAGSARVVSVEARVRDAAGVPVTGAALAAQLAGGRVVATRELGDGRYAIDVVAPRDPGRGQAALEVEVVGLTPGPPRRVSLHALREAGRGDGSRGVEAWVDDDLGLPVPGVELELVAPTARARAVTDRYGTARLRFVPPPARLYRVTAMLPALPGVVAALDHVNLGGATRAVASVVGSGLDGGGEAPGFPSVEAILPLGPALPMDVRLAVEPPRPGQPVRIRVELRDERGAPGAGPLVYQAAAGRVELVEPPRDGVAELRFTPPSGARAGSHYLVSVTDAHSAVTAFIEVVLP